MKRFFVVMLLFSMIICACACADSVETEIKFLNIPWLCNETIAFKQLIDNGFLRTGAESLIPTNDGSFYLTEDEKQHIFPTEEKEYQDVCLSFTLNGYVQGNIAGYPIKNIILSFAYNGEYKLILSKVELINAKYDDIMQKMEKVYGKGNKFETFEGIIITTWKGKDNSCVLLYNDSDGMDFDLYYGRTDAVEILDNCLQSDPNDVTGL